MKLISSIAIIVLGVFLALAAGLSSIGWIVAAIGGVALVASLLLAAMAPDVINTDAGAEQPDPLLQAKLMNKL